MMPVRTQPLLNLRADFPLLQNHPRLTYLDNAATTHQPAAVLQAQHDFTENHYANVHRAVYDLANTATAAYEAARAAAAAFINAAPEEIIFTSNATHALNLAAAIETARLRPGDEILVGVTEHHSNLLPWWRLAQCTGAKLVWLEPASDYSFNLTDFYNKLSAQTKIIAVSHISNVLGYIAPLAEIIAAAHHAGARVAVDAAQSASRQPLDVKMLDADYLAVSGHKLYGPTGTGWLYAKRIHLENAAPLLTGGGTVQEVSRDAVSWQPSPLRFEAGTPNITGVIGLHAALTYLTQLSFANIHQHEQTLVHYARPRLQAIPGLTLYAPPDPSRQAGIFSFTLTVNLPAGQVGSRLVHSHDVSEIANQYHVAVRGGHHCAQPLLTALGLTDLTRASLGIYNTTTDIDKLIMALEAAQHVFSN